MAQRETPMSDLGSPTSAAVVFSLAPHHAPAKKCFVPWTTVVWSATICTQRRVVDFSYRQMMTKSCLVI